MHEVRVPPRLRQHALARVDQYHGQIRRRGAGHHVAGVLFVSGRVGDDEFAFLRAEEPVGDVDRNALFALGREPVDQQREIDVLTLRAEFLGIRFEGRELIIEDHLRVVEQPADQR